MLPCFNRHGTTLLLTMIVFLLVTILFQLSSLQKDYSRISEPDLTRKAEHVFPSVTLSSNKIDSSPTKSHPESVILTSKPPKPTFKELGTKYGTDKIYQHGYDRFYPFFLEHLRDSEIKMLEIGYLHGESYKTWVEYFSKGKVFYMEKDGTGKNPAGFQGDQGNENDLERLLKEKNIKGSLDFIIDDGSHHPVHQFKSFMYLFQKGLKPGGIYIIEDIEMNYWYRGNTYGLDVNYGRDHPQSLISKVKELVHVVNREFAPTFHSSFGADIDDWVSSVFFGANCVVIVKMTEAERKSFLKREYRYIDRVKPKP